MIPGGGGVETKKPVTWLEMKDGEGWIMRPVSEGMCQYESIIDCKLDLADIARMNEHLDVRDENERRYRKAQEE